jgi:hypothetical protein
MQVFTLTVFLFFFSLFVNETFASCNVLMYNFAIDKSDLVFLVLLFIIALVFDHLPNPSLNPSSPRLAIKKKVQRNVSKFVQIKIKKRKNISSNMWLRNENETFKKCCFFFWICVNYKMY